MVKRIISFIAALALMTGLLTGIGKGSEPVEVQAADDTCYVLSVATGTVAGTGVLYIGIMYKDADGYERTHIIRPNAGDYVNSLKRAGAQGLDGQVNGETYGQDYGKIKRDLMKSTYFVNLPEMNRSPLSPHSVDDYIFNFEFPMREILGLEFYLDAGHTWTCEGMSLYEVKNPKANIKGIDMKGYLSNFYYIDFEGTLIAAAKFNKTYGDASKDVNGNGLCTVVKSYTRIFTAEHDMNLGEGVVYVDNYMTAMEGDTKVYLPEESRPGHPSNATYAIELDFASAPGSGLKGYTQAYNECLPINRGDGILNYKDALMIEIVYEDVGGTNHAIYVPAMLSLACYLNSIGLGGKSVFGLGQPGDSIVFPITLPGYSPRTEESGQLSYIVNKPTIRLIYSEDYLDARMCQTQVSETVKKGTETIYGNELTRSVGRESISFSGFQIYENMPQMSIDDSSSRLVVRNSENPIWYYTDSNESGLEISYETDIGRLTNSVYLSNVMNEWSNGSSKKIKKAVNSTYYGEIAISSEEEAATLNDIEVSFMYLDNKGKDVMTETISMEKAVQEFYGTWPLMSKDSNAYTMKQVDGGTLRFIFDAKDVRKFTGVKLAVKNNKSDNDHFQLSAITVYGIDSENDSIGERKYSFAASDSEAVRGAREEDYSMWDIMREIKTTSAYVSFEQRVFLSAGDIKSVQFGVTSNTVIEEKDVDWTLYKGSMTYTDTETDMGYAKIRNTYNVTVKVASDEGNMDNDAGSRNQFYFQLIFDSGKKTGYVLANQQLASDCFRSGCDESFSIYTNYDYGNLTGVRIIPDDQQEESDVYDKLKIDTISITRDTGSGISRKWICDVYDWITIDYADSGAYQTLNGRSGRTAAELTRSYPVSSVSYDLKFIVEIDTAGYNGSQLEGTLAYSVNYSQVGSASVISNIGDAVKGMAKYMGNQADYGADGNAQNAQIDPNTMLKAGKTSRFEIELARPEQIHSIDLFVTGKNATMWNISAVRIYKIVGGTGGKYYEGGTIVREYETLLVASTVGSDGMGKPLTVNVVAETKQQVNINFNATGFSYVMDVDPDLMEWNTLIEAEPNTKDYVLNTYIFIDKEASFTKVGEYDLICYLNYTYDSDVAAGRSAYQKIGVSASDCGYYYNSETGAYKIPVQIQNLKSVDSISMKVCEPGSLDQGTEFELGLKTTVIVTRVMVEQICSNVLIDTYEWDAVSSMNIGVYNKESSLYTFSKQLRNNNTYLQRAVISFGEKTDFGAGIRRNVDAEEQRDFGVALAYTTKNNPDKEIYSITKFASDMDIDTIKKHQYITVDFMQPDVNEIKGIRVIQQGDAVVYVDAVTVINYSDDSGAEAKRAAGKDMSEGREILSVVNAAYNIGYTQVDRNKYMKIDCDGFNPSNQYLNFCFKNKQGLTPGATVEAAFTYATQEDGEASVTTSNLAEYVQSSDLGSEGDVNISMVMNRFESLHVIQLDPKSSDGGASWNIESITITGINTDGREMPKQIVYVNSLITERTNESEKLFRVNACNIFFDTATAYKYNGSEKTENYKTFGKDNDADKPNYIKVFVDNDSTVVLNPNASSNITADRTKFVKGSFEDITVDLYEVRYTADGHEGFVDPTDSMRSNINLIGDDHISRIEFKAENNSYTNDAVYVIQITSKEVPSRSFKVYVIVDKKSIPQGFVYDVETGKYINSDKTRYFNPETGEYSDVEVLVKEGTDETVGDESNPDQSEGASEGASEGSSEGTDENPTEDSAENVTENE